MPKLPRPLDRTLTPDPDREVITRLPDGASDKPPLLFVHGALHGAWCWDQHWMPELASRGWPCYAVSWRGHGRSGGREQLHRWRLQDYERDVVQAITHCSRPPVLVGHSLGALVVDAVMRDYHPPAAVLVAPIPPYGAPGTLLRIARRHPSDLLRLLSLRGLPPRRDYFFSDRLDDLTASGYTARMQSESLLALTQLVLPRRAGDADLPVLVLGAEDDALVDPVHPVRTARHYGTQARMFRGMGHDLMLDAGWRAPLEVMVRWLEDHVLGG